jgi:hypothetical protein
VFEQGPTENEARRGRLDALLREDPCADQWQAREEDTRWRREREEEVRRWVAKQRRPEQDKQDADHAVQAVWLGQNQDVTAPVMPVSSLVQYPSISALATTASAPSGPMTAYLQMPLEIPTRCVIFGGCVRVVTAFLVLNT